MTPAPIPAPELEDVRTVGMASRRLRSRVVDTSRTNEGDWHLAVAAAYLPVEKDVDLLQEIAAFDVDVDVWEADPIVVVPTWSHDHAVAALGGLLERLDELRGGLVIGVPPYNKAVAEPRRRYVDWLVDHGFRVAIGTSRNPKVMYRAPGGGR